MLVVIYDCSCVQLKGNFNTVGLEQALLNDETVAQLNTKTVKQNTKTPCLNPPYIEYYGNQERFKKGYCSSLNKYS